MVRSNWCILLVALFLSSCGYRFQGLKNPLHDVGIRKIFVKQFKNETFRPGLEHVFTTAMIREIEKSKLFEIVNDPKKADAIVTGSVTQAEGSPSSSSAVTVRGTEQQIAAQFSGTVTCAVSVEDGLGRTIYGKSETSSKLYPGLALTGRDGASVPLHNESEQRLAFHYMAGEMMANVYQGMVDLF